LHTSHPATSSRGRTEHHLMQHCARPHSNPASNCRSNFCHVKSECGVMVSGGHCAHPETSTQQGLKRIQHKEILQTFWGLHATFSLSCSTRYSTYRAPYRASHRPAAEPVAAADQRPFWAAYNQEYQRDDQTSRALQAPPFAAARKRLCRAGLACAACNRAAALRISRPQRRQVLTQS
jgi:hypothetical protein